MGFAIYQHESATGMHVPPPNSEHPSCLPPHPLPSGLLQSTSFGCPASCTSLHWSSVSHMKIYMFQCYSLKSSHPRPLPQSPKVCSLHLCLLCCPACRITGTVFLNSIYMHKYIVFAFLFLTYFTLYDRC